MIRSSADWSATCTSAMAHRYVLFLEGPLPAYAWTRPFHVRVGKDQPELEPPVAIGKFVPKALWPLDRGCALPLSPQLYDDG